MALTLEEIGVYKAAHEVKSAEATLKKGETLVVLASCASGVSAGAGTLTIAATPALTVEKESAAYFGDAILAVGTSAAETKLTVTLVAPEANNGCVLALYRIKAAVTVRQQLAVKGKTPCTEAKLAKAPLSANLCVAVGHKGNSTTTTTWKGGMVSLLETEEATYGTFVSAKKTGNTEAAVGFESSTGDNSLVVCELEEMPAPTVAKPAKQTGTVGTPATLTMSGEHVEKWSASGLPVGLSIAESTGVISGTPTLAGTYKPKVTGSNVAGEATVEFEWTIKEAAPTLTNPGAQVSEINRSVSLGLQGTYLHGPVANIVPNPSFAHDGDGSTSPAAWSTLSSRFVVSGATVLVHDIPEYAQRESIFGLDSYCAVTTSGANAAEGVGTGEVIPVVAGVPITVYFSLYEEVAGQELRVCLGSAATGEHVATVKQVGGGKWGRHSVTLTPTETGDAIFALRSTTASKITFLFTAVSTEEFYVDGDTPGYEWAGTPGDSSTYAQPVWSATGLPAGLSINTGTGLISGTPTSTGTSTVHVAVKSSGGEAKIEFAWTVEQVAALRGVGRQGVDVTIRFEVLNGVWETVGAGRAIEVLPETVGFSANDWGPEKASFTLKRNPWAAWPDLLAFTPVEIEVGGVLCWEGRTGDTPIKAGAEQQINVQCEGWQYHLDDDVYKRMYVHSTLTDWKDARSFPTAPLADYPAAAVVQAEQGILRLTWPKEQPASGRAETVLDLGMGQTAAAVVLRWEATAGRGRGLIVQVGNGETSESDTEWSAKTFYVALTAGSGVAAFTATTPGRYVKIIYEAETGTPSADETLTVTEAFVYADTTYVSTENTPILKASTVVQDALKRATLLLSKDYSQIDPEGDDSFDIPSLVMGSFATPRQQIEAVNAYNNWTTMIDLQRRMVYKERPREPALEVGSWSGEEIEDQSAGEGAEIYNRVVVEGTNAEGTPVSYEYYGARFSKEASRTSTIETTYFDSEVTCEGELQGGVVYTLIVALKYFKVTKEGDTARLTWGGNVGPPVAFPVGEGTINLQVTYQPFRDQAAPTATVLVDTTASPVTLLNTSTASILEKAPTLVDKRGFRRTKTLRISNVLTEGLATVLAKAYLESHGDTPYGGSLTAKVGSVRQVASGQPVHPSQLGRYVGENLRTSHAVDPNTGGIGRDGRIASVEYSHADQSASVTLNSRLQNFEAMMARLAVLEEVGS